jgi:hypothetical protein
VSGTRSQSSPCQIRKIGKRLKEVFLAVGNTLTHLLLNFKRYPPIAIANR